MKLNQLTPLEKREKNDLLESKNKNFKDAIKVVVDKVISN